MANVQNNHLIAFYRVEDDEWIGSDRHATHTGLISDLRHFRNFGENLNGLFDSFADADRSRPAVLGDV